MLLLFYDELPQLKISRSSHQRCSRTGVLIYFSKFHGTSERLVLNSKKLIALQILHFQTVIIGPNQTGFYRLSTGILKSECRVKDPGKWGILFNLWLMGFNYVATFCQNFSGNYMSKHNKFEQLLYQATTLYWRKFSGTTYWIVWSFSFRHAEVSYGEVAMD